MELFEAMRREYEFGVGTIQGVARKLGVHRRMVREAIASAVPAEKAPVKRPRPRVGPLVAFIDAILEEDRRAPRKQRHTAHRIYTRIRAEHPGCEVAESTVRQYVRARKRELWQLVQETCPRLAAGEVKCTERPNRRRCSLWQSPQTICVSGCFETVCVPWHWMQPGMLAKPRWARWS